MIQLTGEDNKEADRIARKWNDSKKSNGEHLYKDSGQTDEIWMIHQNKVGVLGEMAFRKLHGGDVLKVADPDGGAKWGPDAIMKDGKRKHIKGCTPHNKWTKTHPAWAFQNAPNRRDPCIRMYDELDYMVGMVVDLRFDPYYTGKVSVWEVVDAPLSVVIPRLVVGSVNKNKLISEFNSIPKEYWVEIPPMYKNNNCNEERTLAPTQMALSSFLGMMKCLFI